jgi:hypothetical protein
VRIRPFVFQARLALLLAFLLAFLVPSVAAQDAPVLPHRAEVVPGVLYVTVYAHDIPNGDVKVPCWSFVSEGFERAGQHEIVFTLKRPRGRKWQDYSKDLFGLYGMILAHAGDGGKIEPYATLDIELTEDGTFLGQKGPLGMICIPAEMFDGVEVPFQALAAVLIRDDEIEAAKKSSALRIASILGMTYRYYPCPPWSELGRKPVVSAKQFAKSFLQKLEVQPAGGVSVRSSAASAGKPGKKSVVLRVEGSSLQGLNALLGARPVPDMFALMTEPDPDATMRYAWRPAEDQTGVIFANMGPWITGSYVAFVVGEGLEERGDEVEDGIVLGLRPATFARIKAALASGKPASIPIGSDGTVLQILFSQTFPVDPLLPKSFVPDNIGLVQSQSDLVARLGDTSVLKDYVKVFASAVQSALSGADRGDARGLLVAVGLKPGKKIRAWLEPIEGALPETTLKKLDDTLARVLAIEVTGGPVAFILKGNLWDRKAERYPDLPAAWSTVKDASGKPATSLDEIFVVIWPE